MSIKNKFASLGFDSFVNGQRAAEERLAALEAANRVAKEESLLAGHRAELALVQAQGAEAVSSAFTAGAILAAGAAIFGLFLKEEKRKETARAMAQQEQEARAAEEAAMEKARREQDQAQATAYAQTRIEREQAEDAVRALEMEVRRREAQARLDALDKRENNNKA